MRLFVAAYAFANVIWCLTAAAQTALEIRTCERQFFADRVETRPGTYLVYMRGVPAPIEVRQQDLVCMGPIGSCIVPPGRCAAASPATPPAEEPQSATFACTPPSATQPPSEFGIHGSNTIGEKLMPMLIERYARSCLSLQGTPGSQTVRSPKPQEQTIELKDGAGALRGRVDLKSHGSGTAPEGLLSGAAQIGMASSAMRPDAAAKLNEKYKISMTSAGNEHVLALDGLAVIVNARNPVATLSREDISRIFAGEITNWKDVGGSDAAIALHARDNKSGTFEAFRNIVLRERQLAKDARRYESSELLSDAISDNVHAVGFIGLGYVRQNKPILIKSACGMSFEPSEFNVQFEAYPLTRRLYLYTVGKPADYLARNFLEFSLSERAQEIVRSAGFIDQSLQFQPIDQHSRWLSSAFAQADPETQASQQARMDLAMLQDLARTYRRVSFALRYPSGRSDLDTKSVGDVKRLARYLTAPEARGKRWVAIGFADSEGGYSNNRILADARARSVVEQLRSDGVTIPPNATRTASELAQVDCNDNEEGRTKNRRVEIWIEN